MSYDMIRRDALLDYCDAKAFNALELWDGGRTREAWLEAFEAVRTAPAVDAEPVRHGRWELETSKYIRRCSACEKVTLYRGAGRNYNYCPNCGAKMMDGDV